MIDLNALRADVQMAQQTGRKMCTLSTGELDSLLARAALLESVQGMIPFSIGWACAEDVHLMIQSKKFRIGLQRTKGPKYNLQVLVQSLPSGRSKHGAKVDLKELLAAES